MQSCRPASGRARVHPSVQLLRPAARRPSVNNPFVRPSARQQSVRPSVRPSTVRPSIQSVQSAQSVQSVRRSVRTSHAVYIYVARCMYVLYACSVHECMQCVYMSCAFMQHICRAFMQYVYMSCILHDSTYACMLHTAGMHVLPCLSMIARACMHLAWIARMHKAWMHVHACIHTAVHCPRLRLLPSSCSMCTCRNGRFHGPLLQKIKILP